MEAFLSEVKRKLFCLDYPVRPELQFLPRSGFKTRVRRGSCPRTAPLGARPKASVTGEACAPSGAPRSRSPAIGFWNHF